MSRILTPGRDASSTFINYISHVCSLQESSWNNEKQMQLRIHLSVRKLARWTGKTQPVRPVAYWSRVHFRKSNSHLDNGKKEIHYLHIDPSALAEVRAIASSPPPRCKITFTSSFIRLKYWRRNLSDETSWDDQWRLLEERVWHTDIAKTNYNN